MQQDSSVKSKDEIIVKNEMTPDEKQMTVEKREWLNLDINRPKQEACRNSSLRLHHLDWSQPQQAKSGIQP